MRESRRYKSLTVALYLNAALLAGVLVTLWARPGAPHFLSAALGQNQLPIGGGGGVFIVPAQFSNDTYGCYIMDIDTQTLCAYQYFGKQLRLVAARNFRWDRRLPRFNSDNPTPDEVRQMVEQAQEDDRVRGDPDRAEHVDPEAAPPRN